MSPNSAIVKRIFVVAALLAALAAEPLLAATIFVDDSATGANNGTSWADAYADLQAALAAAVSGDTIWVAAGEYKPATGTDRTISFVMVEGVEIYGGFAGTEDPATFDLASRDFVADEAILSGDIGVVGDDADNSCHVVVGANDATVDGFTIMGGNADTYESGRAGGGVYCDAASPVVTNCTIVRNKASCGGGIYCLLASPRIENCAIADNTACGTTSRGGGVYCDIWSSATIVNCIITGNRASDLSATSGDGGGLYSYGSSLAIANCTITDNAAASSGGGLYCHVSGATPVLVNSIVAFNSSGICASDGSPGLRFNCVYGNAMYDYSGVADPTGTDGNMSIDPKVASLAYGNWHIQPDSPCVDAGSNADAVSGLDIDWEPRIQPAGAVVDIGADESDGRIWYIEPPMIVRVSPNGDDANDGSAWPLAKRTVQAAIDVASVAGGEVWVGAGSYHECIVLHRYAHVFGGFAGTEVERDQRDSVLNPTVLDGQQQGAVVTARKGHLASTIDGFTITGAEASSVGAVDCELASPTIAHCTITGNEGSDAAVTCKRSSPFIRYCTIADNDSAGIRCSGSAVVTECTITRNHGIGVWCHYEGIMTLLRCSIEDNGGNGVRCVDRGGALISQCVIARNTATSGGGIFCRDTSPSIVGCTITSNVATGEALASGGGIFCLGKFSSCSPSISHCTIENNIASGYYAFGGGVYFEDASPRLTGCTITTNRASGSISSDGGGVYCDTYLYPAAPLSLIESCTIVGNSAANGGGLCSFSYPKMTITNTIVAFNSSGIKGGAPILRYNCVYGNAAYDYSGVTDPAGTEGNISADPTLGSLAFGDWHLQPDSPCVDAGDNAAVTGNQDIDGQPRVQPIVATVDIGADESDGTLWSVGPEVIVRVSPDGDDANNGSSWTLAKRTVQAGIDTASAAPGEVWVRAGTYEECITLHPFAHVFAGFDGAETEREQRDWANNVTVLDCQESSSAVTVLVGDRLSTIDGFTVTHSAGHGGAGVSCVNASATIANCAITGNSSVGVWCSRCSPLILNCMIVGNTATRSTSSCYGGGIFCDSSRATILGCTIAGNTAMSYVESWAGAGSYDDGSFGGGICSRGSVPAALTVANCTIRSNSAIAAGNAAGALGGGIHCDGSARITDCVITGNEVKGDSTSGGGISCRSGSTIVNCTITGNSVGTGDGGGIACSSAAIINTIVAFNSSGIRSGTNPILRHNCVYGNAAYDYRPVRDPTGTNGNISVDPVFVSQAFGEWHIQSGSPCRDAGENAEVAGNTDIDAQARIEPAEGIVDIGADEFDGTTWPAGPFVVVRVSPAGDDVNDGSSWALAKQTVQAGIDAAAIAGGEVWVQAGTYHECITLHPFAHVLGGFGGSESNRDQRDWTNNATVLDAQQQDTVVTAYAGEMMSTIDGFTITGGVGSAGGGVSCVSASPTVANCEITANTASSGGGIYCRSCSPVITGCRIAGNAATSPLGSGGGVYSDHASLVMRRCSIVNNTASYHGGGWYDLHGSSSVSANCTIAGNVALYGGGVYCYDSLFAIANCTIVGNDAVGGAVYWGLSRLEIANTIMAFNSSGLYRMGGDLPVLRHNCVFGNTDYNYGGLVDPTGSNGNIAADPRIASVAFEDWHIQPDSPCVDSGSNSDVIVDVDMDAQLRIQPTGGIVDIGADESDGTVWPSGPADFDVDGDVDLSDFSKFEACFNGPNRAPMYASCGDTDIDGDGDVDLTDFTVFASCFNGHNRPPACW